MRPLILTSVIALASTAHAAAQDWPQFRGPDGQGHSTERGLPLEWSESQNVVWKTPVPGLGWSSPVVSGGRVWLTTAVELPGPAATATSRCARWPSTPPPAARSSTSRSSAPGTARAHQSQEQPRVADADRRRRSRLRALRRRRHRRADDERARLSWKTRFPYESQHGNGGSPVALRRPADLQLRRQRRRRSSSRSTQRTGKDALEDERAAQPADQAYSTPLVIRVGDRDQLVSVGAFRAAAYDPHTGKEIWRVSYGDGFSNVPRPVFGHGLVYIATGFQQPSLIAVRPDGTGDVTKTHIAWTLTRGAPLTPSPLLVGDELYIVSDNGIASLPRRHDRRDVHWQQRLGGTFSASPVLCRRPHLLPDRGRA